MACVVRGSVVTWREKGAEFCSCEVSYLRSTAWPEASLASGSSFILRSHSLESGREEDAGHNDGDESLLCSDGWLVKSGKESEL